jgi:type I restriction enzyme, S subunit
MAGNTAQLQTADVGEVPAHWLVAPLSVFVSRVTYGFTNPMPTTDDGPFMVTAKDIHDGRINYATARHTSWNAYNNAISDKSRPRLGDVLLTKDGSIGRVAICDRANVCINQSVALIQPTEATDPRFLKYLLQAPYYQNQMERDSDGTTIKHIYITRVDKMQVAIPPLPEQRAIAHILGSLDDKIELNQRMSETLEAMARALFKSWFVDFDPVRAKAEGRDPGLPQPLADLFPARLVDSELGEIPEGWRVETLGDHYEAVKGVSYKGSGLGDSGVPLHNLNSIYEGGGYKYEGIKYYSGEYAKRHIVLPGDVIVANTEQGHDRLLIGYAALVPAFFGDRGIASHHIYRLRPKPESPLTAAFLRWLLSSPQMHDIVSGYANGTTVNMLPIDGVQKPLIVRPPTELVAAFDSVAVGSERRREEMVSESRTLATLRDALLPKLISGELRVQDAKRFIEGLADG